MRSLFTLLLVTMTANVSSAGLFDLHQKGCGGGCPKRVCQPAVARPACTTIFSHQRRVSQMKCCGEQACGPASCCAPVACLGGDCSAPELFCGAEASCCAPTADCCVPEQECCTDGSCGGACGAIGSGCGVGAACYSKEECQIVATLIHESMTGCYASIRRKAIHRLGDHFDAVCHPEIMNAFIYALNDSDESVRQKAADEIGDQIRRNRVCIGQPVVKALQCALADCHRPVRRQAEEALRLAGYRIVDGACCQNVHRPTYTPGSEAAREHVEAVPADSLPIESQQVSQETKQKSSLKVLPVSSRLVSKLKPIADKLRPRRMLTTNTDIVPPPTPPEEPADYVPEVPTLDLTVTGEVGDGALK